MCRTSLDAEGPKLKSAMVVNSQMSLVCDTMRTTTGSILGDQSVLRGAGGSRVGVEAGDGGIGEGGELTKDPLGVGVPFCLGHWERS